MKFESHLSDVSSGKERKSTNRAKMTRNRPVPNGISAEVRSEQGRLAQNTFFNSKKHFSYN